MSKDYYEYEEYSRRRRDFSPDNYSGGTPNPQQGPPPPSAPPYASTSRLDDPYYGDAPSPRERMTLEPPESQNRPRSVPPNTTMVRRSRSRSRSRPHSRLSSDDEEYDDRRDTRKRSPSPITRARNAVDENFSHSASGIGAGLLGAVVGGLVAREATEAATRRKHKTRGYEDENEERTRLVSTILGAVAGGLGANALANRVEDSRERDRQRQVDWERERSYVREQEMPRYERQRSGDRDRDRDRDDDRRSRERYDYNRNRALPQNDEEDYDFVYDDPRYEDREPPRRRNEDNYRYRQ
ncbi:hypothetical protein FHETE_5607 [Fusarium heterosporum]|uniref:Glycine zipper 2TM domain-containing protein n=1 Tax=Fusarium heterosporum TaxID=42747 RepID=A0A8H5WRM8_FUSHE|nr:hypothetical protein FHETE_5607 [Fusarium heterosporum]